MVAHRCSCLAVVTRTSDQVINETDFIILVSFLPFSSYFGGWPVPIRIIAPSNSNKMGTRSHFPRRLLWLGLGCLMSPDEEEVGPFHLRILAPKRPIGNQTCSVFFLRKNTVSYLYMCVCFFPLWNKMEIGWNLVRSNFIHHISRPIRSRLGLTAFDKR